jgi:hypothetical protein
MQVRVTLEQLRGNSSDQIMHLTAECGEVAIQ